mmetsp:Transcript_57669/g.162602  ORF Transcript_57669/g.162602 Transcript_57669/m.162602 type:complete len:322 (+) Transcript_57669:51-1016(+)
MSADGAGPVEVSFVAAETAEVFFTYSCDAEVLADKGTRAGYSMVGVKWREFVARSRQLSVEWRCSPAVGELVARWLFTDDDLVVPPLPPDGALFRLRETLDAWEFAFGEDWRSSRRLRIDFANNEGARIWFTSERRVAETLDWFRDDVVDALHAMAGADASPWTFLPVHAAADMAVARAHHFALCSQEVDRSEIRKFQVVDDRSHHRFTSLHCSSYYRYFAAFQCPSRGERTREEARERFAPLGLCTSWSIEDVRYKPRDSLGVRENMFVLSVTFQGQDPDSSGAGKEGKGRRSRGKNAQNGHVKGHKGGKGSALKGKRQK